MYSKFLALVIGCSLVFNYNFIEATGPLVALDVTKYAQINSLRRQVKQEADAIIRELLTAAVADACPHSSALLYPEFKLKPQSTITLYFVGGSDPVYESDFAHALAIMRDFNRNKYLALTVKLSDSLDYFGAQRQELVVLLDDSNSQLTNFRDAIREAFRYLDSYYRTIHNKPIYDIAYSELLPFKPHLSLGNVSLQEVTDFLAAYGKEDSALEVYNLIKERVYEAAATVIFSLDSSDKKIVVDSFDIWSGVTRTPLKHYNLGA